jgi:uncharacterized membrane protein YfcA
MEIALITFVALGASLLTFFSGFGLGTILTPFMAIFFPVETAIALTGIVHLLNNLFKFVLVRRHVDWPVVLRFGVTAIIGAALGALLLGIIPNQTALFVWQAGSKTFEIRLLKLIVAALMVVFVLFELLPHLRALQFERNKLMLGSALSGFFGGLTGHQGALRSAFLIKCGLSKEKFVATGVVIASAIDITRLGIYSTRLTVSLVEENKVLLLSAILAAFAGAWLGSQLLKKVALAFVQYTVSGLVLALAVALGVGLI